MDIHQTLEAQRRFFREGRTLDAEFRVGALAALYEAIIASERDVLDALYADTGKSPGEAYMSEVGLVLEAISFTRKRLKRWMKPRRVLTPLYLLPGRSRIYYEPYGCALIMAPWNYPFHLALMPVISAVAAGNCVLLKPSSRTPATMTALKAIMARAFETEHAAVLSGNASAGEKALEERFDFILYTGSAKVGKQVLLAAARDLTPVCLELGGKSPAIVLPDADLQKAARSIAWGKQMNAGQTCVAPDYVLAHADIKGELERLLRREFERFPGPDAVNCPDYARIISPEAMDRLLALAPQAEANRETMRMAPLVLPAALPDDPVMREEIFGPILPVLPFTSDEQAVSFVREREKPLACYLFTQSEGRAQHILRRLSFGGGCVNDTMLHMSSPGLPFGGVGRSGMGRYHGLEGFKTFSNTKGVLHKGRLFDLPMRYPPYSGRTLSLLRRILR